MSRSKWTQKKMGPINSDGKFEEGMAVLVKKKQRWHEDWAMIMQGSLNALSKDRSFNWEMWRVWAYLVGELDFENFIVITQKKLCEDLGMHKQNVSRTMIKLVEKGIILRGERVGRSTSYKMNSKYVWKGTIPNLSKDRLGVIDFQAEAEKRKNEK